MSNRYIGISEEASRFSNTTASELESKVRSAAQAEQDARRQLLSLEETFKDWNDEIDEKNDKIADLEDQITEALKEKARLNSVRYNKGSASQRAQGEACKKKFGLAGAWDGNCGDRNTQRQRSQQDIADNAQTQITKLRKEVASARQNALAAQRQMAPVREKISRAQAEVNRSLAELEQGKALNNTEALAAREKLAEANRRRETELQALQNQLAQVNADSAVKQGLIAQETQALQANADLQKGSVPIVIGFVALVVLSFVLQPMLKKKA